MTHLGLMLFGAVIVTLLIFLLVIGWRWYFAELDHRHELLKLSELADERISQVVAQQSERIKASTRAATTLPEPSVPITPSPSATEPAKPAVTLNSLPEGSSDVVFTDPVPLTEDVEPARLAAVKELQKQFWAATSWEAKLPFVADAERVKPLMKNYYEVEKGTDPVAGDASHQIHFKLNNTEVLLFTYTSPRPGGSLDMAFTASNGGKFLLDWESFVGASEVSWATFKKERPTEPRLFRVFASQDDYFNYEFGDSKRYLSFHLSSPDGFFFLKGYCERESAIGRSLSALFASGAPRMAFTLRLAFPEKSLSDHCVSITGVVANRWLIVP